MPIYSLIFATLAVLGIGAASPVLADDFRVSVNVSAKDDDALGDRIKSYLSRELRALHDVEITDLRWTYQISVIAFPTRTRDGFRNGNALSILVVSAGGSADTLEQLLSKTIPAKARRSLAETVSKRVNIVDHELRIGSTDELQDQITEFVATFDTQTLQPMRDFGQRLDDVAKDATQSSKPSK